MTHGPHRPTGRWDASRWGPRRSPRAHPLAGCGGAPPPAVDSISRAGYLSCPNDNAVHDRSGHPGGYHNPGWKNAERSGGGRRCLNRLRGHPLDNTVIAIDTRTGAVQFVPRWAHHLDVSGLRWCGVRAASDGT